MTNLVTKLKSTVSTAVLFAAAVFMVGLGFAFVGTIAMIASAFVTLAVFAPADAERSPK